MPCKLLIGAIHDGVAVRLVGRGTMQQSLAFRTAIDQLLSSRTVVFDATQCDYLDSTFLGCLVGLKKKCDQIAGCRFIVAASAASRARLFSTSSLHRYFEFIDASPEMIGQCGAIEVDALQGRELGTHVLRCHEHLAERGGAEAAAFNAVVKQLAKELGETSADLATHAT